MFGSLPPEIMMYLQQMMGGGMQGMPGGMPGMSGMQGAQQPQIPQTRFSGPLGHYGLLAQQLGGGQQGTQQPLQPQTKKKIPGLLGGTY